jgi:uncharacterized hydrophobic protein (TIGR00271 family)
VSADASDRDLTALGRLVDAMRSSALRVPDDDAEASVAALFPARADRIEYVLRFAALIALSSSIAAFGLMADSAGVVIGAMLVAPLMTPILATAAATVRADNRALAWSLLVIALGTVLAILVGYLVSVLAGDVVSATAELPSELEARTFPGLLDLGVAVTAGAAAGYIVPRRSAVSALPGVGIAVALIPPLATVGVTWQLGAGGKASNALLLYATNLAAIVFAASIMLLLAGFRPQQRVSPRVLATRILVTLTAVTLVAVPLTVHTTTTLEDSRLVRSVSAAVVEWDSSASILDLTADVADGVAHVELLITGPNEPNEVWRLAEAIREEFGLPVELDVRYQQDEQFEDTAR